MDEKKSGVNRTRWLILIVVLFAAVALLLTGLHYLGYIRYPWEEKVMVGGNAKKGNLELMSDQDLHARLQQKADESMVSFKINGAPVFQDGESQGTLFIENPGTNTQDMSVDIYLEETGELIYESERLKPGYFIDYDTLKVPLAAGTHEATAYIQFYNERESVSKVAAALEITVNH